jgi:hypothetical protein
MFSVLKVWFTEFYLLNGIMKLNMKSISLKSEEEPKIPSNHVH